MKSEVQALDRFWDFDIITPLIEDLIFKYLRILAIPTSYCEL